MLQGKELILATKPFAKEIRSKSWMHLWIVLAVVAVAQGLVFLAPWLWLRIVGSLLHSLVLVRLFIMYHDYLHHAILQKSKLANFIMTCAGLYMLTAPSIWKKSHDFHHKHNSKLISSDIGSYPIAHKEQFLNMPTSERRLYLLTRHWLTMVLGYFTFFLFGITISSFINEPKEHKDSLLALVLHVGLTLFLILQFGWLTWLLALAGPFLLTFAIGAYLFYAQHNFPAAEFVINNDKWAYEKAALTSSSYMKLGPVMQWFTGNIGFHHIHHLNARIPFYRLPEAYKALPELRQAKATSLKPKDILACLRLKVWDEDRQRMIGFKELKADMKAMEGTPVPVYVNNKKSDK